MPTNADSAQKASYLVKRLKENKLLVRDLNRKISLWELVDMNEELFYPIDKFGIDVIKKIDNKYGSDKILLIQFFYIDDVWLMTHKMFRIATADMIIKLELRLRKEVYKIPMEKRIRKEKHQEELTFGQIVDELERIKLFDPVQIEKLREINQIYRNIFLHTNMKVAEPRLDRSMISRNWLTGENLKDTDQALYYEGTRTLFQMEEERYCYQMLDLALEVLHFLHPDLIQSNGPFFDEFKLIHYKIKRRYGKMSLRAWRIWAYLTLKKTLLALN